MSDQADTASVQPSPARGIAGQIVANASLLIAVLVYMGWAYDTAFYGYFHVNPVDLDIGIIEYMLVSLSLFSSVLVASVAVLVFVGAARTWQLDQTRLTRVVGSKAIKRILPFNLAAHLIPKSSGNKLQVERRMIGTGAAATVIALTLVLIGGDIHVSAYVVLVLLGGGPLLLTWPNRTARHGHFPYALAIILAAVCALWAASLYATLLGRHAAEYVAHNLAARTAVTLYTAQPLALNGPGIQVEVLPTGTTFHYRYQGLCLLTMRSGTYYLLPVGWSLHRDSTYVINASDQIRIDLY